MWTRAAQSVNQPQREPMNREPAVDQLAAGDDRPFRRSDDDYRRGQSRYAPIGDVDPFDVDPPWDADPPEPVRRKDSHQALTGGRRFVWSGQAWSRTIPPADARYRFVDDAQA